MVDISPPVVEVEFLGAAQGKPDDEAIAQLRIELSTVNASLVVSRERSISDNLHSLGVQVVISVLGSLAYDGLKAIVCYASKRIKNRNEESVRVNMNGSEYHLPKDESKFLELLI